MIDLDDLLAEAEEWASSYVSWGDNGLVDRLIDALESMRAEHDAALACIADLEMALIAEVAKMRGREPIAICLDEACDVAPGGRPYENRKAVE